MVFDSQEHLKFLDRLQMAVDGVTVVDAKTSSKPNKANPMSSSCHSAMKTVPAPCVQSLQRNLPRPQTASMHSISDDKTSAKDSESPKASTLPRIAFVCGGGGKQAAPDLSTSDDYVLFSALDYPESFVRARAMQQNAASSKYQKGQSPPGNIMNYCDMLRYADEVGDDVNTGDVKGSQISISQVTGRFFPDLLLLIKK